MPARAVRLWLPITLLSGSVFGALVTHCPSWGAGSALTQLLSHCLSWRPCCLHRPREGTASLSFDLQLPRCPQQVPVLQAPGACPAETASSQARCRQRWHLLAPSPRHLCSFVSA